jgi:hypothetical protein
VAEADGIRRGRRAVGGKEGPRPREKEAAEGGAGKKSGWPAFKNRSRPSALGSQDRQRCPRSVGIVKATSHRTGKKLGEIARASQKRRSLQLSNCCADWCGRIIGRSIGFIIASEESGAKRAG